MFPVTGAVHVNVRGVSAGRSAMDAGEGPEIVPMVDVPNLLSADGTTFVCEPPVLNTVMVKVAVSPEKTQPVLASVAVKLQLATVTVMSGVVTEDAVRVPVLSRAEAVNLRVPDVLPAVYVQTMVPVAPGPRLRFAGFDVVVALTPLREGGLGTEVTPVMLAVERLVTLMVKVNWQPFPTLNVDGVRVMARERMVHEPTLLMRTFLPVENVARTSRNMSVVSAVVEPQMSCSVKSL